MPPTRASFTDGPLPSTAFLMLVSLAEADAHGYQLRKELIERSGGSMDLDPGSLYRLIFRLDEDGLIEDTAGNDPRRRSYRITALGRRVLRAETERLSGLVAQAQAIRAVRARKA